MQQTELSYFFVEEKSFLALRPLFEIGALAQSVEQRTENPCVAGSIPAGTTKKTCNGSVLFGLCTFC